MQSSTIIRGLISGYLQPEEEQEYKGEIEWYCLHLLETARVPCGKLSSEEAIVFTRAGLIGEETEISNIRECMEVACKNDDPRTLKLLLSMDLLVKESYLFALWTIARYSECWRVFEFLFLSGLTGKDDASRFVFACRFNQISVVKKLLLNGIDPTMQLDLPIVTAVESENWAIFNLLLEAKANVTTRGNRPLFVACQKGNAEIVKVLLEAKADPRVGRDTLLLFAYQHGQSEIVKILLDAKAIPDYRHAKYA